MKTTVLSKRNLRCVVQFVMSFTVVSVLLGGLFIVWSLNTERAAGKNLEQNGLTTEMSSTRQSNGGSLGIQSLLSGLNSGQDNFERAIALDQALIYADRNQLKELLQELDSISSMESREAVQQELFRRYANVDPVSALDLIKEVPRVKQARLAEALFQEWASSDLDSAIEQVSALSSNFLHRIAFDAVLEIREDLTESEKSRIGHKLRLSNFEIQDIVSENEISDTASIENIWNRTLRSNRPFNLKNSALIALARRQIDDEGLVALEKISKSIKDWKTRQNVLVESIRWAARWDPRSTFDFALNSFSATEPHLVSEAVKHWVEREPENALSALSQLPISRFQEKLLLDAMSHWASYEPRGLLRNLDLVPSALHSRARTRAFSRIRDFSTHEVTQLVEEQSGSWGYSELTTLVRNWKSYAFEEALDWVLKNFDLEESGDRLANELLSGLTSENAVLALDKALNRPLDSQEVGFEAYIVAHLVISNVDAAINALPRLRNDKTRETAIQQSAYRLSLRNQWNNAWEFGSRLSKTERTSFLDYVIDRWLSSDPAKNLVRVERLPSLELRSRAAMWAIEWGHAYEDLSPEVEAELRKYLLEEDIKEGDDIEIRIVVTSK